MSIKIVAPGEIPTGRPTAVHARPCRHCPAAHHPPTPDSVDVLEMVKSGQLSPDEATYACGWNQAKRCKGAADKYGYVEVTDAR